MNVKINRFQLFSIMLMGRAFSECLNIPNEVSYYGMQRFTVIFLSRMVFLMLCIPLIVLVHKYPEESFFSIIAGKNKIAGWIIFTFLSAHLVFMAVFLSVRFEVYVQNTVMSTASSSILITIFFIAVLYGVVKGLQASMRAGQALIIMFAALLVVGGIALVPKMELNYLYPAFIDQPDTFIMDIITETVKNTQIYIFLLLSRYTSKNSGNVLLLLVFFSLLVVEYMHFSYMTILGPYLDSVSFPFYTNASLADIVVLDRLDGLDMVIWTITSVLEVTMMVLCIKSMLFDLIDQVKADIICVFITLAAGVASFFGSLDRSVIADMYSELYMGITLIVFIVLMPLSALFVNRKKGDAEFEKA